jgi:type II secretory pathway component PulM
MFRDLNAYQPRKEPPRPKKKYRQLTPREEKLLIFVIAFNLLVTLFSPFCGSTVVDGVISLFRLF